MDINELRKLPLPKLRDLAKQTTDLQGIIGMKKEDLIEAVAKAQGISYRPEKDLSTISSIKQEIRALKKQKDELLTDPKKAVQVMRLRRKIKQLKRQTRSLAKKAAPAAPKEQAAPSAATPSAPA